MKRDYTSDTLRTIAALMVVLVHVVADYVNLAMKSDNFNLSFWVSNIVDSFCRICLPIFVMISGMFLLGRTETFRDSYRKRASKILIPLIFWTIIYLVYLVVLRLFAISLNRGDLSKATDFSHLFHQQYGFRCSACRKDWPRGSPCF